MEPQGVKLLWAYGVAEMELIEVTKITIIVASLATVALAWSHWRELVAMFGIQKGDEPSEVVDEAADEAEKSAERMAKSQRLPGVTLFERVANTGRAALGKNRLAKKQEMLSSLKQAQRVLKRDELIIKALLQRHPSSAEFNEITESFETFKRSVDKAKKVAS